MTILCPRNDKNTAANDINFDLTWPSFGSRNLLKIDADSNAPNAIRPNANNEILIRNPNLTYPKIYVAIKCDLVELGRVTRDLRIGLLSIVNFNLYRFDDGLTIYSDNPIIILCH